MAVTVYTRGIEAITSGAVDIGAVDGQGDADDRILRSNTRRSTSSESQVTRRGRPALAIHCRRMNVSATVSATKRTTGSRLTFGSATWTVPSARPMANVRKAVYYASTGNASTDRLLAVSDFGANTSATNQTFTVAASVVRLQNVAVPVLQTQ